MTQGSLLRSHRLWAVAAGLCIAACEPPGPPVQLRVRDEPRRLLLVRQVRVAARLVVADVRQRRGQGPRGGHAASVESGSTDPGVCTTCTTARATSSRVSAL